MSPPPDEVLSQIAAAFLAGLLGGMIYIFGLLRIYSRFYSECRKIEETFKGIESVCQLRNLLQKFVDEQLNSYIKLKNLNCTEYKSEISSITNDVLLAIFAAAGFFFIGFYIGELRVAFLYTFIALVIVLIVMWRYTRVMPTLESQLAEFNSNLELLYRACPKEHRKRDYNGSSDDR